MPGIVEGSSLIVLTFSDVVVREEINDFPLPRQEAKKMAERDIFSSSALTPSSTGYG